MDKMNERRNHSWPINKMLEVGKSGPALGSPESRGGDKVWYGKWIRTAEMRGWGMENREELFRSRLLPHKAGCQALLRFLRNQVEPAQRTLELVFTTPSHNRDGLPLGVLKLLYLGVAAREGLQAAPGQQSPERLRSCLMWEADNACGTVCHCPGIS